jgi:hypothetical protein
VRIALALLASSSVAVADDGGRPWLLDITVQAEIGLDKDAAGDPVSVAPDIGLLGAGLPRFEIIHSAEAFTGFHGIPRGTSACVYGDVCDAVGAYHSSGLQISKVVRSHAKGPTIFDGIRHTALDVHGGLLAYDFDPFALALKLGLRASYLSDDLIQIQLVPSVHIAVTERDLLGDQLFVPLTVGVLASPQVTLLLETGIAAPFDGFADNLRVPLGLNLNIIANERVSFFVGFSATAVHGGDAIALTGFDARVLTVGISWKRIVNGE